MSNHFLLSSLFHPASYRSLYSLSFFSSMSPFLLISLVWFGVTVQTRLSPLVASCHVLPLFSFGDHFTGRTLFSSYTHTFTQTQSALPYPFGDCLTNKAFCRFYADVRRPTPLGPRSTCLAALLRLMNNAVNRITFYHLIVSAQQWLRVWGSGMRRLYLECKLRDTQNMYSLTGIPASAWFLQRQVPFC